MDLCVLLWLILILIYMILNITNILHDTFMLQNGENNTKKKLFITIDNTIFCVVLCCTNIPINCSYAMIVWLPQIVYLNVRFGTWEKPKYFYLFIYLFTLFTLFRLYGDDDM